MTKKFVLDKSSETRRNLHTHTHTHTHTGKFCLAIISCLFIISINPTFADTQQIDIAPGANVLCNAALLGATSGTVRLRANFVPENIDLKWYDGNTQVNVSSSSNTCEYDTAINLPTNPSREGYEFNGWKVVYDLSEYDTDIDGTLYGYIGLDANSQKANTAEYGLTEPGTFGVTFSYGKVIGRTLCSETYRNKPYPDETQTGQNCWCKITGFNSGNILQSAWYGFWYENTDVCVNNCASYCAYKLSVTPKARRIAYGQSNEFM